MEISQTFTYVPHHRTLTKSGQSHFSRVSDAIAEFIDNSLQATQANPSDRNIRINLELDFYSGASFLTIYDNGKGMNEDDIRRFAKYSDTKQYSNNQDQDPTNISKFGVGSKEAGFYLGDRLHVITKSHECDQAIELVLDENEMEAKYRNDQNVYEENYILQPLLFQSTRWQSYRYPSQIQEIRRRCEQICQIENQSFTLIVLKLRNVIVGNLQRFDSYDKLPATLADIYHFHLHPDNLPTSSMKKMMSSKRPGDELETHYSPPLGWKDPFRDNSSSFVRSNSIYQSPSTPLNIILEISSNKGSSCCNLKDFRDMNTRLFENASFCFRFTFQLPDPDFEDRQNLTQAPSNIVAKIPQKLWTQEHTGASHREVTVHGLILYFPFRNGRSTRPLHSITSSSQDGEMKECYDLVDDDGSEVDSTIRVYWQNRLVPETRLSQLPFFPKAKTALQCERAKLPLEWRDRVRGFIFFDSNFANISNNKLKLKADPDFETWIHNKEIRKKITYNPKNIDKDFERWLQSCHQTYDNELKFDIRVHNDESLRIVNSIDKKEKFYYLFSQLTHSIGQERHVIKTNDSIKIIPTKGKKGTKEFVFAKVLGFLPTCEFLPIDQNACNGTGHLWYQQIPVEVYGQNNFVASLSSINFDDFQVTEEDLQAIRDKAACSIKTVVHRTDDRPEHLGGDSIKKGLVVDVGENIKYLAVRVLNKNREVLISPPGSTRKYRVRMTSPTMGKDFGTSLITYSRENTERVVFMSSDKVKDAHQGFHLFQDLCFRESGHHIIRIEVLDGDMLAIPPVEYPLIVGSQINSGPVTGFGIEGDFSSPVPLGGYLPPFSLVFRDEMNQLAIPPSRITVSLFSPGMVFTYNEERFPEFEIETSTLNFENDQWLGLPLPDAISSQSEPFISSNKVGSKKVKIGVKVSCCDTEMIFHVTYMPGCPHRLSFISPLDGHLSVPNGEIMDSITLACQDEYGNRCSPTPQFGSKWYVRLDKSGPLSSSLDKFPVQTDGTVTLDGLYIELEEAVAYPGVRKIQPLLLEWPEHLGFGENIPPVIEELCVTVTPGTKPSAIEVMYNDDVLSFCRLPVATVMTGLKLQIMTENNTPWDPLPTSSLVVKADWHKSATPNKKKSKGKKSNPPTDPITSLFLPDIKLPSVIADSRLMFEVECTIDSKHSFASQFVVELIPLKPIKWKIFLNPDVKNGVQCLAGDLSTKVQGVWLVDEYGNDIAGDFLPSSRPSLLISWDNDDTLPLDQSQKFMLNLEERQTSSETGVFSKSYQYALDPDASLISHRSLPAPFWLWAYDDLHSYESCCEALTATSSPPSKIFLRCPSILGNDSIPTNQLQPLSFTTTSQIGLEVYLMDNHDCEASLSNLQDLHLRITTAITSEIIGLEIETQEIIFYQKKNPKNKITNISINFHKLIEGIERYRPLIHEETFELIVSCSYTSTMNGQKCIVTPSLILCKFLRLNIVTKLIPSYQIVNSSVRDGSSTDDSIYDLPSSTSMSMENCISCGKKSKIILGLCTEDNQRIEIDSNDIDISISYPKGSGDDRSDDLIEIDRLKATFRIESTDTTTQTTVSYLLPELKQTGKYTLTFFYTESRPKLIANQLIPPSALTCKATLTMNCIAGSGRKLEPSVKFQHQLDNLCVTTSLSSAESDRIIAKSLEINLKDQYGNDAIFPENSFVRCKLFRLSYDDTNHSNPRDVPYFVDPAPGREFSGVEHLVSIPVTQYCHSFPLIQLQASEDTFGGDGNLELIFELCSTEHFHVSHIEKFAFHLRFTTDEGQASKERQFRDEVSPFQEQLEHLRMNLDQSEHEKLTLERKMKDVIRRANGLHLGEYLSTSQLTQSELFKYEEEKLQEKNDMLKANSHVRTCRKINSISIPERLLDDGTVIGQVVDIGCVESDPPMLAYIMSWAASEYMHALVVPNGVPRREGYFSGQSISYWEVDQIPPFRNSKGRTRTRNEISNRAIPLDLPHAEGVSGNPRFMVNLIQLKPDHEYLRDTVFFQIYQNSILMDTEKDAVLYRDMLIENGARLRGDGLRLVSDRLPEQLDYLFGERSVTDLVEFRNLTRELEIIDEMKQLLQQQDESMNARIHLENEIRAIEDEIKRIESKYGLSKSKKIRKASEIYEEEINSFQSLNKKRTRK